MKSLSFQKLNISGADVLTRLQMKKVMGGHDDGGDGGCNSDSDCGTKEVQCNGSTVTANGYCRSGKCRYVGVC